MQIKHSLFVFILIVSCFTPIGKAEWIWSPTESKGVGSKTQPKQEEVTAEKAEVTEELKDQITPSPPAVPAQTPTPKLQESRSIPAKSGVVGAVQKTTDFLENVLRLRKKTPEQPTSGSQAAGGPYSVWSPSEGKFVSPATASAIQKTAEEQYQHALKLRETGKPEEVIRELERVVHEYPQSAYAPEAQFLIAVMFEEKEKPLRAAAEFQKLIREFPRSERIDEAVERLFRIGNQFLTGQKQKVMGVALVPVLSKAADIFRFIVEQAPYGPYGDQAQLVLGTTYRKMGNYEEAVKAFEALIENYPSSLLVDEAHYQLAETSYEFSQNVSRDQKTRTEAASHLKDFIKQYGSSTLAERAQILKQQLDEQDAEKNYRIGLYYEKQGFVESALIYYEDVSNRYSETPFGKKAAERFGTLKQPALAKQKGEAEIERRTAEVRSMLEALEAEGKRKGAGTKGTQDTAPLRSQLEAELASLTLVQKQLQEEVGDKFYSRRQALRDREKNLREKFKIFEKRKKLFRDNPSPELDEAFQKWEQSLKKEQEELLKERQTVGALGLELKPEATSWFSWIPYFGKPRTPSEEKLLQFEEKKWNKLEQERIQAQERRKAHEKELAEVAAQIAELDAKEFEIARKAPLFQELLSPELKQKEKTINERREQLDQSIRLFEGAKKEYQSQYGDEFLKTLVLESNVKSLQSANELIASGTNLEEAFKKLQSEKASLSLAWLAQKERLNTVVKAFGETQPQVPTTSQEIADAVAPSQALTGEDQATEARILKKRIKYLEREIRSRVDQIEDWQRENTKRTDQLEELLHPKISSLTLSQTAGKVLAPATGAYKLGKAFLFGLPHRERELMQEAQLKTSQSGGDWAPEKLEALRELQEEIELQSILIQGRAKEIEEMQGHLTKLRKQASQIPNFTYQSVLIERFPYTLDQALTNARELLGEENQEAIFQDRVNRQKRELERLEGALIEINQKIEAVGIALKSSQPQKKPSSAVVIPSILGDAETLPSAVNESSPQTASEGKSQLESKLVQIKSEINQAEKKYQDKKVVFDNVLLQWYQTEAREKILQVFPADGKLIIDQKKKWGEKQQDLQKVLVHFVEAEYGIVESQKKFLDQKLAEFEKRLRHLKDPSGSLQKILDEEIRNTTQVRDSLIRDISFLESYLKK